jgi:hypothetical protein
MRTGLRSYAARADAAFHDIGGHAVISLPVGDESHLAAGAANRRSGFVGM